MTANLASERSVIAYLIAAIMMTLSVLEGHSSIAILFGWDVLYICAPVHKISTDKRVTWSLCNSRASCTVNGCFDMVH